MKITKEMIEVIEAALKRGNSVELKKEQGRLVIVEIARKLRIKSNTL